MHALVGKVIDNYHVLTVVGKGGMGVVFKAMDTALERVVALKMIDAGYAQDEAFLKRFRSEAKALAKLENPHIVTVFALRETEAGLFMVMEFVEGQTLADIIRERGALPQAEALQIMKQILTAIGHAHEAGIAHRDLKPNNIMIHRNGVVKVTDFGLAKKLHSTDSTMTMGAAGTLKYMSPEQVKNPGQVDHRTDLYSLGMTFYEMLAGRTPFENADSEFTILKAIVEKRFPSPADYKPDLPKPLAKIIMKAIAKAPAERFQSASEMLQAIIRFEEGKATPVPRVIEPHDNKRPKWALVVGFALVLVMAVMVIIQLIRQLNWKESVAQPVAAISITSDPGGAEVSWNGKIIGTTPLRSHAIDTGAGRISIYKADYFRKDTSVFLEKEQSAQFYFALQPAAKIAITVRPEDAEITLDGKRIGVQQLAVLELAPGEHKIEFAREGYKPQRERFELQAGLNSRDYQLEIDLNVSSIATGVLRVNSDPPAASIFLDGGSRGTTPRTLSNIAAGSHKIVLKKSGYGDYSATVTVQSGERLSVSGQLRALTGKLRVRVLPWGSIYIDNQLQGKENTDVQFFTELASGPHRLKAVHPVLGIWEKTVEIPVDDMTNVIVDFNKQGPVRVTSFDESGASLWADIWVDKKPTGKTTPQQLQLRIGRHELEVRREGYEVPSGPQHINVEGEIETAVRFVLKKI